jgi:hypothetical protein
MPDQLSPAAETALPLVAPHNDSLGDILYLFKCYLLVTDASVIHPGASVYRAAAEKRARPAGRRGIDKHSKRDYWVPLRPAVSRLSRDPTHGAPSTDWSLCSCLWVRASSLSNNSSRGYYGSEALTVANIMHAWSMASWGSLCMLVGCVSLMALLARRQK